jgi:hypothetical protein
MPVDTDAAERGNQDIQEKHNDRSQMPEQRIKTLVTLDRFRNSICNLCQLWLGGIPAPPRQYEHWQSRLVQQEKISFTESTTSTDPNMNTITTPMASMCMSSTFNDSQSVSVKASMCTDTSGSLSVRHPRSKANRQPSPHELLHDMYKHTNEPVPE